MEKEKILQQIAKDKVIAIVRGVAPSDILPLAKALGAGGVTLIEVTFDQSSEEKLQETLESIRAIKEGAPEVLVGAGTVMNVEQVHMAIDAGAEYIISPNVNEAVIKETVKLGKTSIPGALTPTEIAAAYEYGADFIKVFPAGELGAGYIKAVKAPLGHIPLLAVGGVDSKNCGEFMKAGASGIGAGGKLVDKKAVAAGEFDKITEAARQMKEALENFDK